MALATAGIFWGRRLREKSCTSEPRLKAIRRMPSNLRSKIQSGPVNRSWVNVAAIGSIHSGGDAVTLQRLYRAPVKRGHVWRLRAVDRIAPVARFPIRIVHFVDAVLGVSLGIEVREPNLPANLVAILDRLNRRHD